MSTTGSPSEGHIVERSLLQSQRSHPKKTVGWSSAAQSRHNAPDRSGCATIYDTHPMLPGGKADLSKQTTGETDHFANGPSSPVCLSTERRDHCVAVFRAVVAGRYLVCRLN